MPSGKINDFNLNGIFGMDNCADPHDLVAVGDSHPTCRSRLKIFGTTNHGSRPSKSYQCTGKRNATADKPNGNPLLHHGREVFSVPAS
jgi:hypothetical protein